MYILHLLSIVLVLIWLIKCCELTLTHWFPTSLQTLEFETPTKMWQKFNCCEELIGKNLQSFISSSVILKLFVLESSFGCVNINAGWDIISVTSSGVKIWTGLRFLSGIRQRFKHFDLDISWRASMRFGSRQKHFNFNNPTTCFSAIVVLDSNMYVANLVSRFKISNGTNSMISLSSSGTVSLYCCLIHKSCTMNSKYLRISPVWDVFFKFLQIRYRSEFAGLDVFGLTIATKLENIR